LIKKVEFLGKENNSQTNNFPEAFICKIIFLLNSKQLQSMYFVKQK
jgi:hypothetical protein